jgi:hypothetical protein
MIGIRIATLTSAAEAPNQNIACIIRAMLNWNHLGVSLTPGLYQGATGTKKPSLGRSDCSYRGQH